MLKTQRTIYTIKHDKNVLPILEHIDSRGLTALSISGGVILWVYKGMVMLIPAARIANMATKIEDAGKVSPKSTPSKDEFTMNDAIILPKNIAAALLGDDK